jgi:hypothetical protein
VATDRTHSIAAQHSRLRPHASRLPGIGTAPSFLFEALRELDFESCFEVAGNHLRFGLAVTQWQLEQARILLDHFNTSAQLLLQPSNERVVALALHTGLTPKNGARAKAVVVLRRDGPTGLALDAWHPGTMNKIRERGGMLVEVEQLAFTQRLPLDSLIMPMVQALSGAVRDWGATDIVAECSREQAAMYCRRLGFKRLHRRTGGGTEHILLHLPASEIARLGS